MQNNNKPMWCDTMVIYGIMILFALLATGLNLHVQYSYHQINEYNQNRITALSLEQMEDIEIQQMKRDMITYSMTAKEEIDTSKHYANMIHMDETNILYDQKEQQHANSVLQKKQNQLYQMIQQMKQDRKKRQHLFHELVVELDNITNDTKHSTNKLNVQQQQQQVLLQQEVVKDGMVLVVVPMNHSTSTTTTLCQSWKWFQHFCDLFQSRTTTQQQQEQQQPSNMIRHTLSPMEIQKKIKDIVNLTQTTKHEKQQIQQIQNQTIQYSKRSAILDQDMKVWEKHKQDDMIMMNEYNHTGQGLMNAVQRLNHQINDEIHWETNHSIQVQYDTTHIQQQQIQVIYIAFITGCFAMITFFFFFFCLSFHIMDSAYTIAEWWSSSSSSLPTQSRISRSSNNTMIMMDIDILRTISIGFQHVLLFLWMVSSYSPYLILLDIVPLKQQIIIVLSFAMLSAFWHTLLLHTIPHIIAECTSTTSSIVSTTTALSSSGHCYILGLTEMNWKDWMMIIKHSILRMIALIPLFSMELILLWLVEAGRGWLLTKDVSDDSSWYYMSILTLISISAHLVAFEPCKVSSNTNNNTAALPSSAPMSPFSRGGMSTDQSTICEDDDDMSRNSRNNSYSNGDDIPSYNAPINDDIIPDESTPLKGSYPSSSDSPTYLVPQIYLSNLANYGRIRRSNSNELETTSHYSLCSISPYYTNLTQELYNLMIPLEFLLVIGMAIIVRRCTTILAISCPWHIILLVVTITSLLSLMGVRLVLSNIGYSSLWKYSPVLPRRRTMTITTTPSNNLRTTPNTTQRRFLDTMSSFNV